MEKLPSVQLCVLFASLDYEGGLVMEHDTEFAKKCLVREMGSAMGSGAHFPYEVQQIGAEMIRALTDDHREMVFMRNCMNEEIRAVFFKAKTEYRTELANISNQKMRVARWEKAAALLETCPDHLRGGR